MKVTIDGKACAAESGEFLLDIARRNDIHIPSLCHSEALPGQACCRICMVEAMEKGVKKVVAACVYPVKGDIEVITDSDAIRRWRATLIMLLAARVPGHPLLRELEAEYAVVAPERFASGSSGKCILCGLCVKACELAGTAAISMVSRGIGKKVSTPYDEPSLDCIGCAACAQVCPAGAIAVQEKDGVRTIWNKTFHLLACSDCGAFFITREQRDHIRDRLGSDREETRCERCRKTFTCGKFRDVNCTLAETGK